MARPSLSPVVLLAACGAVAAPSPDVVTRDSAGVTIVETNRALWGDSMPWIVDTAPVLAIGQAEGEDPYLLDGVRSAIRLDGGSIVLIDPDGMRQFDSTGRFVRAAGRRGPGPGEFSRINRMRRCGTDEIWVDAGSRLSIWGTDLSFRREFALPKSAMWPVSCFDGAGLVVQAGGDLDENRAPNRIYVSSLAFFIVDSLGGQERAFMEVPLRERLQIHEGRQNVDFVHPFGRETVIASQGPWVAITDGRSPTIRSYDATGQARRIVRGPVEDLSITDSMLEAYHSADPTGPAKQEREWLELAGNPMPDGYPAYTELVTDTDGNLWAKRFSIPGNGENRWGVFDPDGRFLGHVLLPAGLEVYEIGPAYVLGKSIDYELGFSQVREYRLRKP